jgi:hypothetical protein
LPLNLDIINRKFAVGTGGVVLVINESGQYALVRADYIDYSLNQISIAGGFFLGTMENLEWWHDIFYGLLFKYFENKRLIKDDQILVADGVFSNIERFNLCYENDPKYDNWFLFQRFLL